jgi:hypothetical protein
MSSSQQFLHREFGAAISRLSFTSNQAAHAVLSTKELLYDIVARLPFRDMVSVTGVCKSWRSTLKEDQHIQQALFLKPMEVRDVLCDNILLNDLERPMLIEDGQVVSQLHPYLPRICGDFEPTREGLWCLEVSKKSHYPDVTWRAMFITQPPCKLVTVKHHTIHGTERFTYERDTGVTLGELHDYIHAKRPGDRLISHAWITIPGYTAECSVLFRRPFTSKCKVRAGEVCRPADLPLRVAYSDTDSSDGSHVDDEDDDDHWDSGFDEDGYYDGG